MITTKEIRDKAERKYLTYLQSIIEGISFAEIVITGDKKPSKNLAEYQSQITELISRAKEKQGYGYTIKWQEVNKREIGKQNIPLAISFQTASDFLKFLHKEKEVAEFQKDYALILAQFLELKEWIIKYPKKVIENHKQWDDLLKVCGYFKANPAPNLYIRELPIKIHTKFIENNRAIIKELLDILIKDWIKSEETNFEKRFNLKYPEPLVRFRVLDKHIAQTHFSGIDDLSIPLSLFEKIDFPLKKVFVVENKMNVLTFPAIPASIVIFGSGYGVENLKNIEWFNKTELFYWGDLDVQGFEILSQFRGYFPHVKSIFMNKETFDKFFEQGVGTPSLKTVLNLTVKENQLCELLRINNWRLEQEKIPLEYVNTLVKNEIV